MNLQSTNHAQGIYTFWSCVYTVMLHKIQYTAVSTYKCVHVHVHVHLLVHAHTISFLYLLRTDWNQCRESKAWYWSTSFRMYATPDTYIHMHTVIRLYMYIQWNFYTCTCICTTDILGWGILSIVERSSSLQR